MSCPHWHPGDIVGVTHSNVTVSKWDVSSLLESGEQSLERGFEEMSFGAGCQLWSHTCAQGMGGWGWEERRRQINSSLFPGSPTWGLKQALLYLLVLFSYTCAL